MKRKTKKVTENIKSYQAEFKQKLEQTVATVIDKLVANDSETRTRLVRVAKTNLGDLCADAIRTATGTDVAFLNSGGIRADLMAGKIAYSNVLSVFPFSNQLHIIQVKWQQLLDTLEFSVSMFPVENGGFLQVSGLTFEFRTDIPSPVKRDEKGMFIGIEGDRRVQKVLVGGKSLDPEDGIRYRASTIPYMTTVMAIPCLLLAKYW